MSPLEETANKLIDAWESLPGGKRYSRSELEDWLIDKMSPAINDLRESIGREPLKPESATRV